MTVRAATPIPPLLPLSPLLLSRLMNPRTTAVKKTSDPGRGEEEAVVDAHEGLLRLPLGRPQFPALAREKDQQDNLPRTGRESRTGRRRMQSRPSKTVPPTSLREVNPQAPEIPRRGDRRGEAPEAGRGGKEKEEGEEEEEADPGIGAAAAGVEEERAEVREVDLLEEIAALCPPVDHLRWNSILGQNDSFRDDGMME